MRIAFVTAEGQQIRDEDIDRPLHEESFARAGIDLEYRYWSDAQTDWRDFELVVLRSPWDYAERPGEFVDFLMGLSDLPTLQNPAGLIRWNLDKNYLVDLAERGVPVVPTRIAHDLPAVSDAIRGCGSAEVIIKPAVSAGSRLTGWFTAEDPSAVELARRILAEGGQVMVQPFVPSVASKGEVSVVVFDGETSHALRKGPILSKGGGFLGGAYQENVSPHQPTDEELRVIEAAHRAATQLAASQGWLPDGMPLLYGRFDVIELDDGSVALMEAELFEPSFFLSMSAGSPDRFTEACVRRAEAIRSAVWQ